MYEFLSSKPMVDRFISKFSGEADEPFILQVSNSCSVSRSFYLSQGLLYTRGAETAGQLRTGNFPSIANEGAGPSGYCLTASTSNSISIEQFIAYMQDNPTKIWRIEATTTNPTPEYGGVMTNYRQGMIKNESPVQTPLRSYADKNAYNLQFLNMGKPRFISAQDIVTMPVAANSTLTLNIYPEVSKNDRVELQNDVNGVKKTLGEAAPDAPTAQPATGTGNRVRKMSTLNKVLLAGALLVAAWFIFKPKP